MELEDLQKKAVEEFSDIFPSDLSLNKGIKDFIYTKIDEAYEEGKEELAKIYAEGHQVIKAGKFVYLRRDVAAQENKADQTALRERLMEKVEAIIEKYGSDYDRGYTRILALLRTSVEEK